MSLGRVLVTASRVGSAQGDAAGKLALRQGVPNLLEVLTELVLTEGCLDTTGCTPRY